VLITLLRPLLPFKAYHQKELFIVLNFFAMPFKPIYRRFLWPLILICLTITVYAQDFEITGSKKKVTIPFRFVRNLVIVKLKIDNKGPYNFIMDTGAGIMIITDPALIDSIDVFKTRSVKLCGLGSGGDNDGYITSLLNVDIPGLTSHNIQAAILKKDNSGLSNLVGMPIHGMLGYDFFSQLIVKVNFGDSTITVYRPKDTLLFKKWERIPIAIENNKPYLQAKVHLPDGSIKESKLVVDLGAGHPLSLENMIDTHQFPKKCIRASLGTGFNGPVKGFISRINQIDIGKYDIKNLISSFPQADSSKNILMAKRDGNLGIGLLDRFIVVFDYPGNAIYLKPGYHFNEPFEHDMSGLEYYAAGDGFKHIIISRVEPGSAGDAIGLKKDDEIVSINYKPITDMSIEQVDDIFKSKNDRNLLLGIYHEKKYGKVVLTLKRRI
jgi:PDZ domain/Aspartyl protease